MECKKCGKCCKEDWDIVLAPGENIFYNNNNLNYNDQDKEYTIKNDSSNKCVFLANNLCSIYAIRPKVCREFLCEHHIFKE